jgi:phage tail sheath protein FI
MATSASPAIVVKEIDLTGVVPSVTSSTGAFVGKFRWGPVQERTLVSDETGLVSVFAAPDTSSNVDFLSAASFLRYSSSLYVVREVGDNAVNASSSHIAESNVDSAGTQVLVKNKTHFDTLSFATTEDGLLGDGSQTGNRTGSFIARCAGTLGDALEVSFCPANDSASFFNAWSYAGQFDQAPGTSPWLTSLNATGKNDELHIAVIDRTGSISGTVGTVLETFPHVSMLKKAKTTDGAPNYISDVINNKSQYIFNPYFGDDSAFGENDYNFGKKFGAEPTVDSAENYAASFYSSGYMSGGTDWTDTLSKITLGGGHDGGAIGTSEYATGFDLFEDTETVQVDMLIAPLHPNKTDGNTVVNDLVSIAKGRQDCVVTTSPDRAAITGSTPVTGTTSFASGCTRSSYLVIDNNFLKVYDKYNDVYVNIPANSSTAGLFAGTDAVAAPWFSPAGQRRGNYLGVTDILSNPNKSQRDTLYKAGINPIANIPGSGVILFGDKTFESRPSAFDRINVRRLFLVLERQIALAAKNVMFEFNDEFTRAEFTNIVEPLLREVQGRRGITDFRVVCDETNNTPAVVDRNEFIASIFIKPARSINFVTLNFVAVRTGVEFEEVVGTV